MRFGELSTMEAWIITIYRKTTGTELHDYFVDLTRIIERMLNETKKSPDCKVYKLPEREKT